MASSPVVLIADDESTIHRLVHATLDSTRYMIIEAADGEQAWLAVQQCRLVLALLDVHMPGRSGLLISALARKPGRADDLPHRRALPCDGKHGLQHCAAISRAPQAIKSDPALAATYVILLTAAATPADIAAGLAAGADHYLTKPFSPLQLLQLVEQIVS